jgi:hypothetical protein
VGGWEGGFERAEGVAYITAAEPVRKGGTERWQGGV